MKMLRIFLFGMLVIFIAACQQETAEPTGLPTITTTQTVAASPTSSQTTTPTFSTITAATPLSLSTPIPNSLGLTIEENEILDLEQYEFVLQQHAWVKAEPYKYTLPDPINGPNHFKAFHDLQVSDEVKVILQQDGITVFEVDGGDMSPIEPLRGLWVEQEHWILEVAFVTNTTEGNSVYSNAVGQIYQDGIFLNEQYGFEEMFGFQLLNGKPFYFYKKDGRIHLSYNNEDLPMTYDEITHYRCCSAAERNPVAASNWVGFWGQRNGVWYYTEVGGY